MNPYFNAMEVANISGQQPGAPMADSPLLHCKNCGTEMRSRYAYCPDCGQATEDKVVSFASIIRDFLEDYFSFDSKVFRSLRPLLFQPGFLTKEYVQGRRARYIPPLRMYLTISLITFLLLATNKPNLTTYRVGSQEITAEELEEIKKDMNNPERGATITEAQEAAITEAFWDNFFNSYLPKLFFLLVPFYALILYALYRRSRHYYVEHLIFSLHFHSFVFVALLFYLLVSSYLSAQYVLLNQLLVSLLLLGVLVYLFLALKRVHGQDFGRTAVKFTLMIGSYAVSFLIFSAIALYISYSMK